MDLSKWSDFFKQYPYSSSVFFSLILVAMEKVVEKEFVCPCKTGFTVALFCCYLLVPMVITFAFGFYLLSIECVCSPYEERCINFLKFLACMVPSVVWLALFLCDGRYIACLKTEFNADFADSGKTSPWKWCEKPQALTPVELSALMSFYISKLAGFAVLVLISVIAMIYKCCKKCRKCLDLTETKPCCSAHGKTCSTAHCKKCCERHKLNCCAAHRDMPCLAHPREGSENIPLVRRDVIAPSPCDKTKDCPCLCHQSCSCDCHKP